MKKLILSSAVLVFSFMSFSQVIEVEFDTHIAINCGEHITYEEVIDDNNILGFIPSEGAGNK